MKRVELVEVPGQVALMALGQPWMTPAHLADILTACYLGLDLSNENDEIHQLSQRAIGMIDSIDNNMDELKHIVGTIIQWIGTQPNVRIYNATVNRLRKLDEQERLSRLSTENDL